MNKENTKKPLHFTRNLWRSTRKLSLQMILIWLSYNNIGNVYDNMGEYPKALSYYEKALAIRQQSLPSNHPDLAASYNNIGNGV